MPETETREQTKNICPKCGVRHIREAAYCPDCGAWLGGTYTKCPKCNATCSPAATYCQACGASLGREMHLFFRVGEITSYVLVWSLLIGLVLLFIVGVLFGFLS